MSRLSEKIPDSYLSQRLNPEELEFWHAGEPPYVDRDEGDSVSFAKTDHERTLRLSVPKCVLQGLCG